MSMSKEGAWGIVFPGQGSQSVGMLVDIAAQYPIILDTFQEASDLLQYDVWAMVKDGPKEKLDQTRFTQPALLIASYALYRLIHAKCEELPIKAMAGHSLGEYTALVAAGALEFKTALLLVAARGFYMQEAVPEGEGAMAAIVGLSDDDVTALCVATKQTLQGVLAPANLNSIGQVVIAGHRELVLAAIQAAKAQGAKLATLLPVSVPSHCDLMKGAAERLQADLATVTLRMPRLPVISNVTATAYDDIDKIAISLVQQLFLPVRWVDTINLFGRLGIQHVIECGPGKVLSGLIKRTDKAMTVYSLGDLGSLSAFLAD
jgi:[acyl-carrier-protein] S-malonyltransferase